MTRALGARAASLGRALALALLASTSTPRAESSLDPSQFHRFLLAPPSVAQRAAPEHTWPRAPAVAWRTRLSGGLLHAPISDRAGGLYVLQPTPILNRIDGRGRIVETLPFGTSPAATSPIVLADGTRLLLTAAGEALFFSPRGRLLARSDLGLGNFDAPPALGPGADGSLLIAYRRRLVRLDGTGGVSFSTRLDDVPAALFGAPHPLVVNLSGAVFALRDDGTLERRADFGGRVESVVAVRGALFGLVDGRRVVELDPNGGESTVRFFDPALELAPLLALDERGELRLVARPRLVLGLDRAGNEHFRSALGAGPAGPGAELARTLLLLDAAGTTLVLRDGSDVALIGADGSVTRVDSTACTDFSGAVSLAPGRAAVACSSGLLFALEERAH